MPNEILWLILLLVNYSAIILFYRLFGKVGLFVWMPISVIAANIQVLKLVELFGFTATLGNIVYASSFLATDILHENHSKEDANRAVFIGLLSLVIMTMLTQLALVFQPAKGDWAQESLAAIFGILPRIAVASLIAYAVSQFHDVRAYSFWKARCPSRGFLWLRNNLSTMMSQLLDTVIFCFIAFWGVLSQVDFVHVIFTTYLLKWITGIMDTPFIYAAKRLHEKRAVPC